MVQAIFGVGQQLWCSKLGIIAFCDPTIRTARILIVLSDCNFFGVCFESFKNLGICNAKKLQYFHGGPISHCNILAVDVSSPLIKEVSCYVLSLPALSGFIQNVQRTRCSPPKSIVHTWWPLHSWWTLILSRTSRDMTHSNFKRHIFGCQAL